MIRRFLSGSWPPGALVTFDRKSHHADPPIGGETIYTFKKQ
ncbi:MAG TPA: hypothetical protein VGD22_03580 [Sphingobacteriaceae bacterium]